MLVLIKYLIIIILLPVSNWIAVEEQVHNPNKEIAIVNNLKETSFKDKAFSILETKCNLCHKTRNKRILFTKLNMGNWAEDVYKQVFIKKRMPKGKTIKLSNDDYQQLLTWITSLKNQ